MPRLIQSDRSSFALIPSIAAITCAISFLPAAHTHAATIAVPAGGSLRAAVDAAQPGDVITLRRAM